MTAAWNVAFFSTGDHHPPALPAAQFYMAAVIEDGSLACRVRVGAQFLEDYFGEDYFGAKALTWHHR